MKTPSKLKTLFLGAALSAGVALSAPSLAMGLDNVPDGAVMTEGVIDFSEVEAAVEAVDELSLHQSIKKQIRQIEGALTALFQGDYAKAMTEFKVAADGGNGMAQNSVGILYEKGMGTPVNLKEAATWYRTATSHGNIDAYYNLAVLLYEGGPGLERNEAEAMRLFNQGCELGDQGACEYAATLKLEDME